ncbi:hypothetical protein D3C78_1581490 [compost metagenome]
MVSFGRKSAFFISNSELKPAAKEVPISYFGAKNILTVIGFVIPRNVISASIKKPASVVLYLPVPAFVLSVALFWASSVKSLVVPNDTSKQPSSLAGSLVFTEFNHT